MKRRVTYQGRSITVCVEEAELSPGQKAWLAAQDIPDEIRNATFVHGRGCNYCHLSGYHGRIGVYELLEMDEGLTDALRREDLSAFIQLSKLKDNYVPLERCALDYAVQGVTSLDEVIRLAGAVDFDEERYSEDVVADLDVTEEHEVAGG